MSNVPTREMLIGACAANNLDRSGTLEDLNRRLGDHLVIQLLFGKGKGKRTASTFPKDPTEQSKRAMWNAFQKNEKANAKASGFTNHIDIVREIARRWKIHKNVNTSRGLLMIGNSVSTTETDSGLDTAIAPIASPEINSTTDSAVDTPITSPGIPIVSNSDSGGSSSSDDDSLLILALSDLDDNDICAALAVNDIEDTGNRDVNLAKLASIYSF